MSFHILTLLPDMVMDGFGTSAMGRVTGSGITSVEAADTRAYFRDKHRHANDAPYGGGVDMMMQPGSVCKAYEDLYVRTGKKSRALCMTSQDRVLNQSVTEELAKEENLVSLCGHYEGIGGRTLELTITDHLSVGDFVLTGRELPAMVMIDCTSRLMSGALNNGVLAEEESFHDNLLEYPQYTKSEAFRDMAVPEMFLSGHHKNIEEWCRQQSTKHTLERRPDLLVEARLTLRKHKCLDSLRQREGGIGQLEETLESYVGSAESREAAP